MARRSLSVSAMAAWWRERTAGSTYISAHVTLVGACTGREKCTLGLNKDKKPEPPSHSPLLLPLLSAPPPTLYLRQGLQGRSEEGNFCTAIRVLQSDLAALQQLKDGNRLLTTWR